MITNILTNYEIQQFIKNKNLQIINSLDQNVYPFYNDGTKYYKDYTGTIFRITLNKIYTNSISNPTIWDPVSIYIGRHIYSS